MGIRKMIDEENRIVIFGAGDKGKKALREYGKEHVICFVDNDSFKWDRLILGVPVNNPYIYFNNEDNKKRNVLIATSNEESVIVQLDRLSVQKYNIYIPMEYLGNKDVLVYNPYEDGTLLGRDEDEWNSYVINDDYARNENRKYVKLLEKTQQLFGHIEIETYNRCNGGCSFCPVSAQNESRLEAKMPELLFKKIIDELAVLKYKGRISLFSNNEPFLDERIIEFHRYARKKLPNARMHLYTNGTLLSVEDFKEIIECLDELIIDNYNQNLELIPQVKKIVEYCEKTGVYNDKVTVVLRKIDEVLTSRGGDAPNRNSIELFYQETCMLPFRELIIRPDGKVSLCCNDPLGKYSLGDVNTQSLYEIWYGDDLMNIRKLISKGRINIDKCKHCDTFYVL